MEKRKFCYPAILLILLLVIPASSIILSIFGWRLELVFPTTFAVIIAVLSAVLTGLSLYKKTQISSAVFAVFSVIASTVSWFWFTVKVSTYIAILFLAVPFVCSVVLCTAQVKNRLLKILNSVIGCIVAIAFVYVSFFLWIFGHIGVSTVVAEVPSESGRYVAKVIDADQGATGGDTVVRVYDTRYYFNLGILKIYEKPDRAYLGEWGEWDNMKISWKDENTLIINGQTYEVD